MITCRELVDLLSDFVAEELPSTQRESVEYHLRLCSSCAAYLESYRVTTQIVRQLPRLPLPTRVAQQLRAIQESNCVPKAVSAPDSMEGNHDA